MKSNGGSMTNYEINKQKILEDYYLCIGAFENCSDLFQKEKYNTQHTDTKEERAIKKGREADLLSNLGKVGEKAFKYIIGLENLALYPNQDPNSFELLWKKVNVLKDFAKKHGINEDDEEFQKLLNYYDENNQKSHNFDYWFSVMDILMKDTSALFEQYMRYNIQSKLLIDECFENDEFKYISLINYEDHVEISMLFRAAIFPNLLELRYDSIPSVPEAMLKMMIKTRKESFRKNGDIFTRLRYASNNPEHLKFNTEEVYEIIKNIVTFIKMIHENNDRLNFDLNKSFAKYKAIEYHEHLGVTIEEIENLFSLELTGTELALTAFETNYTYSSIKRLLDIGVPKEHLRKVMREGLYARTVEYFFKQGIYDYSKMREYLDYYIDNGEYSVETTTLKK